MRIRVVDILDLLASGLTQKGVLEEFPDLEEEDIVAAINYARGKIEPKEYFVEQAWLEEIERRNRKLDSGEIELIPVTEAIRKARKQLS